MRPTISDAVDQFGFGDVVYLNNASVSRAPRCCITAVMDFMEQYNRAGPDSAASAQLVADVSGRIRSILSAMLRCQPDEIAFTQSTTDGINIVTTGLDTGPDSNVVIRSITHEHHANVYPYLRMHARPRMPRIDENGLFDVKELVSLTDANTALVGLSHGLYNTGAIMPLEEVGYQLDDAIPYMVDAAQTVGCIGDYDFSKIRCGFIAFNGSKWLCGPMGTGLLYCSRRHSALLEPAYTGGESAILYGGASLAMKDMPDRLQAGYRNYAGLAGLSASLQYMQRIGFDRIGHYDMELYRMLQDGLTDMGRARLYGPHTQHTPIVSFTLSGHDPADVVERLARRRVVVALREINDTKVVRVSPHFYNTPSDIESFLESIRTLAPQ